MTIFHSNKLVLIIITILLISTICVYSVSDVNNRSRRARHGLIPSVHAFFYLWYGNPTIDGEYKHWNHEVLPHWQQRINIHYSNIGDRFQPPENLHSPYYPLRGPFSSNDEQILKLLS